MKQKTPQEKKTLSYAKDNRSAFSANDKAGRRLVTLRKAQRNRAYRKKVNDVLQCVTETNDIEQIEIIENEALSVRKNDFQKFRGVSLKQHVETQLAYRKQHAGKGKTGHKKLRDAVENLKIKIEQKADGVWIAEAVELNNVRANGETREKAIASCRVLAECFFFEELGLGKILEIGEGYTSRLVY